MARSAEVDAGATGRRRASAPIVLAAGTAAGLVAGMFGVGGGILLVPVLVVVLGRSQHVAHATSLVAVTLAASSGATGFALDDAVSWTSALILGTGAVVGARLGAALLPRMTEGRLKQLFALLVLVVAVRFLLTSGGGDAAVDGRFVPDWTATRYVLHVVGGLAAGVTSSVLGIGGGTVMVPLMALGFGYGQQVAQGTSLAVIVPTAVVGAASHARNGYTDWRLGLQLGVSALLGSWVGSQVAVALDPVLLARLFGVLQLVVGVLMLRGTRRDRAAPRSPGDVLE